MKPTGTGEWRQRSTRTQIGLVLAIACVWNATGQAQSASVKTAGAVGSAQRAAAAKPSGTAAGLEQRASAKKPSAVVNESVAVNKSVVVSESNEADQSQSAVLPRTSTPAERDRQAWTLLTDAVTDSKHTQARIQALAALGLLRSARARKLIAGAMGDPDLDVRTAAVLAAGMSRNRRLEPNLRNLLDDKEPQVAFTAAMTLWRMGNRSGEDILMSVVNGDRSAKPSLMRGTEHRIDDDLHNPALLAREGALQGAYMLLGPFGFGIEAIQFIHPGGGDLARVSAIDMLAEHRTGAIHRELLAALADKSPAIRSAAAEALAGYRDRATSMAIYQLFTDKKSSVQLIAAAAYLRTTGTPGPPAEVVARMGRGRK